VKEAEQVKEVKEVEEVKDLRLRDLLAVCKMA
jgi:ribosomal protein L20A (L18A)